MHDPENLGRQKDVEIAGLEARLESIELLREQKKASFDRELRQIREAFAAALQDLDKAAGIRRKDLTQRLGQEASRLKELEARLAELLKDADPQALNKRLTQIEEKFLQEAQAASMAAKVTASAQEIASLKKDYEEKLAARINQAARLRQELNLKEQALAQAMQEMEQSRAGVLAEQKILLEKKEQAFKEMFFNLETELAQTDLRLQETTKLIEAKRLWLEGQRSRRLDTLKSYVVQTQAQNELCQKRLMQEREFWLEAIGKVDEETKILNMKLTTFQAQLDALEARRHQELQQLTQQEVASRIKRETEFKAELAQLRKQIEETNAQIAGLVDSGAQHERRCQEELGEVEQALSRREQEVKSALMMKEEEFASLRKAWSAELKEKTKALETLRHHYKRSVIRPALEAKQKHVLKLKAHKAQLKEQQARLIQEYQDSKTQSQNELTKALARVEQLKQAYAQQARSHRERLKQLEDQWQAALLPQAQMLGELEKQIELARAHYRDELARLEEQKNNAGIEMGRLRSAFEVKIENKRKELLAGIAELRSQAQAQKQRHQVAGQELQQALQEAREHSRILEEQIKAFGAQTARLLREKQQDIERLCEQSGKRRQSLEEQLKNLQQGGEHSLAAREKELADLARAKEALAHELDRDWQNEQQRFENERVALLDEINIKTAEGQHERENLTLELSVAENKMKMLEAQMQSQTQQRLASQQELEKRRQALLDPLEAELKELEAKKSALESSGRERLASLEAQAFELSAYIREKRRAHAKETADAVAHNNKEINDLKKKLSGLQDEHGKERERLLREKQEKEKQLSQAGYFVGELKTALATDAQKEREILQQAKAHSDRQNAKARERLQKLQWAMQSAQDKRQQQLELLQQELAQLQLTHQERLGKLKNQWDQEIDNLRHALEMKVKSKEEEAEHLAETNNDLAQEIAGLSRQLEQMKKLCETRRAEQERRQRQEFLEIRTQRQEWVINLKRARRELREALKESQGALDLARLKTDLRRQRLESIVLAKQQEWGQMSRDLMDRLESQLSGLNTKAQKLGQAHEAQQRLKEKVQREKQQAQQNFDSCGGLETSGSSGAKHLRENARKRLLVFEQRTRQLIADCEREKARLLELAQALEPLSEGLRGPLTELTLHWERELRRMENFMKALEENSIWRQP